MCISLCLSVRPPSCIGAIYFDQGVDAVRAFIQRHMLRDSVFTTEGRQGATNRFAVANETEWLSMLFVAFCLCVCVCVCLFVGSDSLPVAVDLKPFMAFQWKVGVTFTNQTYAVQVGINSCRVRFSFVFFLFVC